MLWKRKNSNKHFMKKISYKLFALLLLFMNLQLVRSQTRLQDVVYLKNGSIIHGTIIEQVLNKSIKIQTKDGNIFVYNFEEVEKITKDTSSKKPERDKYRSPGLAFGFSVLYPGIGQFYNHQVGKALIMSIGTPSLLILGAILMDDQNDRSTYKFGRDIVITSAGIYIWSLIDAPTSAARINKKAGIISFNNKNKFNILLIPHADIARINNYQPIPVYGGKLTIAF